MLDSTNSNTNMLDPTATVGDFEFAFNDVDLSDRVLRVEIVANSSDFKSDDEGRDAGHPNRKRRRENLESESEIEDEATHSDDSDCSPVVVDVKTFHISSAIVAAKSLFFYKLFKNGMRESQQRDVTLRIHVSEEAALMDILKFMYSNTLSAVTIMSIPHLLSVLIVADKFQIIPCMQYTIELLQEMPMSLESALSYLELPSCVAISEVVQPLMRAAKQYLTTRYKNISRSKAELMNLPLSAVEVVLGSDGMQVFSEEEIFNFILEWARKNYPKLEERRDILSKRLVQFVCFPNMDCHKLKEVLICPEFDHREVYEHVLNALVCKVEGKNKSASRDRSTINGGFIERIYEGCPVQIVTLQMSRPHYIIYLELKKKQCQAFQSSTILSKPFWIGGRGFTLNSRYEKVQRTSLCLLSLHVFMFEGSGTDILDYEFEVMKKSSEEYESKGKKSKQKLYRFTRGKNLFRTPSTKFTFDDNEYFINGILQLRATLAIFDSQT